MRIENSSREEFPDRWLELRRNGITATEIGQLYAHRATVRGLRSKKANQARFDNPYMQWGRTREILILAWLQCTWGMLFEANSDLWAADDDPRHLSTPDAVGDGFTIEVKTTVKKWERLEQIARSDTPVAKFVDFQKDGITHYYAQCQWQFYTCGVKWGVFCWEHTRPRPGVEIPHHTVEDPYDFFEPGERFYVIVKLSGKAVNTLKELADEFFEPTTSVEVPDELWSIQREINRLTARLKVLKSSRDQIVAANIPPDSNVESDYGSISYTTVRPSAQLDAKLLQMEQPETYKAYLKPVTPHMRIKVKVDD